MVGVGGESGGRFAGEGDEGAGAAFEIGKEVEEFARFAGIGEGDDGVAFGEEAEVSVEGVLRMKNDCGGAGGGEGGGDFVGDVAGLADANKDHFFTATDDGQEAFDGCDEGFVQSLSEALQRFAFESDDLTGRGKMVAHRGHSSGLRGGAQRSFGSYRSG